MTAKTTFHENAVYSLRLRNDLFTLVQLRRNCFMQFFDVFNDTDEWQDLDLNHCRTLHFSIVATTGLKRLFSKQIDPSTVRPSTMPIERRMLRADLSAAPDYSAKLIELTDTHEALDATELSGRLSGMEDVETIHRYELAGMQGDPAKVSKRLIRYFETGVNWDESKAFLFKGIAPPSPDPLHVRSGSADKNIQTRELREEAPRTSDIKRRVSLDELRAERLLGAGDTGLLRKLEPAVSRLIARLTAQDAGAPETERLAAFEEAFAAINAFEDEISTPDREAILAAMYVIGALVGLDRRTQFCERWRGDW